METNTVTTNDKESNGEAAKVETEAETEAKANSKNPNSSNNGINSNSKNHLESMKAEKKKLGINKELNDDGTENKTMIESNTVTTDINNNNNNNKGNSTNNAKDIIETITRQYEMTQIMEEQQFEEDLQ